MSTLGRMWRALWQRFRRGEEPWEEAPSGALESDGMLRPALRLTILFALLFGGGVLRLLVGRVGCAFQRGSGGGSLVTNMASLGHGARCRHPPADSLGLGGG